MRSIHPSRSVVLLGCLLAIPAMALTGSGQDQNSAMLDTAAPSKSQGTTVAEKPKRESAPSRTWRHFGDHDRKSVAESDSPGAWHHFGPPSKTPAAVPAENASRADVSSSRLAGMERELWVMVNHDRQDPANSPEIKGGHARPLKWNEKLAAVARAHSLDMMEHGYFDHVDPQGKTPEARIDAAGIPWKAMGENIAINGNGDRDAEDTFMHEPRFQHNHRANILNPEFTDVGIGIVQDKHGRYFITQDFVGNPPSSKTR
jgi:uncharacterized protein YkwD